MYECLFLTCEHAYVLIFAGEIVYVSSTFQKASGSIVGATSAKKKALVKIVLITSNNNVGQNGRNGGGVHWLA